MTPEEWRDVVTSVTDAMVAHTKRFTTPMFSVNTKPPRLRGTGNYVQGPLGRLFLTCQHVAHHSPLTYEFVGNEKVLQHPGKWIAATQPLDIAFSPISEGLWSADPHGAATIPYERVAVRHEPTFPEEVFFFLGYAGENATQGMDRFVARGTGYCTQIDKDADADDQIFELLWDSTMTQITPSTAELAKAEKMRFEDPEGFSGSLVWNTRVVEVTRSGKQWSPDDAVVSGLLRRYDPDTKTLLVYRIEHVRKWLEGKLFATGDTEPS